MLAKKVMKNGIDNRILERITQHHIWSELYDAVSYSPALHNLVEDIIMSIGSCDQREILRLRYFENLPWDCVTDHMDADIYWVKEQNLKALKKIHVECTCCEDCCHAEEE